MNKKKANEELTLLKRCIADARGVLTDEKMMDMQSHVLSIAIALFKQRAVQPERRSDVALRSG